MRSLIVSLLIMIFLHSEILAHNLYKDYSIKYGILKKDEIWQGKILLIGDVVVPDGIKLKIDNQAEIYRTDIDIANLGHNPKKIELIIGDNVQKIVFRKLLINFQPTESIRIEPKPINFEKLVTRWHFYRHQYSMWPLIYSLGLFF